MSQRQKRKSQPAYIESFQALYREQKYPHAFIIASRYPELKKTPEYAKMQEHFHSLLRMAALHIKKDEPYKAQELIREYARVAEKRVVVKLLLAYGEEFLHYLRAINEQNFEQIFTACKLHPDFENVPSYLTLRATINKQLDAIEADIDAMNLERDFSLLEELAKYLPRAKKLQKKLHSLQKLHDLYEKRLWSECYELIEKDTFVQDSLLAKLLNGHWYKRLKEAKEYAKIGEIESVYETIREFGGIESKKEQIRQLLYSATKNRIRKLLKQNALKEAERLLFKAAEQFGKEEDLIELAEEYFRRSGVKVVFR